MFFASVVVYVVIFMLVMLAASLDHYQMRRIGRSIDRIGVIINIVIMRFWK